MKWIAEASPRFKARVAGVLFLLALVAAIVGEFVVRRFEIAGDFIAVSGMVGVTLLLYDIFKPVNRGLPAANSGRADGVCWFRLAHLSSPTARTPSIPLQSGTRRPRARIGNAVAARDRCKRTTMGGAGQPGGRTYFPDNTPEITCG